MCLIHNDKGKGRKELEIDLEKKKKKNLNPQDFFLLSLFLLFSSELILSGEK
jgi:hypothetical protein